MGNLASQELADLQAWFGNGISQKLPDVYADNPLAISMPNLQPEANALLNGKGGFSGFERLGVYNQQYWFRLITIMQSGYTCAVHHMGLRPFNQWAIRYLQAHPPASPFLADLDTKFPAFMEAIYREGNRESVLQAIAYDRAYSVAFDAPVGIVLARSGADASEVSSRRLCLATHVSPLRLTHDFPAYRALCLPDESLEGVFELKPMETCLVVYRNADLDILEEPVCTAAWAVLMEFRAPTLLTEAFERLAGKVSPAEQSQLEAGLSAWFQDWVARDWLGLADLPA